VDAVDRWIDDVLDHDAVNKLVTFTSEDVKAVARVSLLTKRILFITCFLLTQH
jgi:hypothetical protein